MKKSLSKVLHVLSTASLFLGASAPKHSWARTSTLAPIEHPTCRINVENIDNDLEKILVKKGYRSLQKTEFYLEKTGQSMGSINMSSYSRNSFTKRLPVLKGDLNLVVEPKYDGHLTTLHAQLVVNEVELFQFESDRHLANKQALKEILKKLPECRSTMTGDRNAPNYSLDIKNYELQKCVAEYQVSLTTQTRSEGPYSFAMTGGTWVLLGGIILPPLYTIGAAALGAIVIKAFIFDPIHINQMEDGLVLLNGISECENLKRIGRSCDETRDVVAANLNRGGRRILGKLIAKAGSFEKLSETISDEISANRTCSQGNILLKGRQQVFVKGENEASDQ